jgi:undecaprenyl-diphosphatase
MLPDLPIAWLPPSDFSFPSGHTLHAFANATLIALHCPPAAVPVLLFAACVGASRVFLAAHFTSDVLAGMLLGIAIAFGVVAFI